MSTKRFRNKIIYYRITPPMKENNKQRSIIVLSVRKKTQHYFSAYTTGKIEYYSITRTSTKIPDECYRYENEDKAWYVPSWRPGLRHITIPIGERVIRPAQYTAYAL